MMMNGVPVDRAHLLVVLLLGKMLSGVLDVILVVDQNDRGEFVWGSEVVLLCVFLQVLESHLVSILGIGSV